MDDNRSKLDLRSKAILVSFTAAVTCWGGTMGFIAGQAKLGLDEQNVVEPGKAASSCSAKTESIEGRMNMPSIRHKM